MSGWDKFVDTFFNAKVMWKYLPEDRRNEYAATDEEAARWVTALSASQTTDARRPPELSTRDNVADQAARWLAALA